jgi:Family of unknown function (DUF6308)
VDTNRGSQLKTKKDDLSRRIIEVVEAPADQLLVAFYTTGGPFAGSTFDDLPDNPRNEFSASDLLAASLLDVRFEPRAVRALLQARSGALAEYLADIPDDVDLWDATKSDLRPAYALWAEVEKFPGVGDTKTSKLLARKRPRLIPIVDSVIRKALPLGKDSWVSLRSILQDEQVRARIEEIRPEALAPTISTLRLLDAATWMRYSRSRNAQKARKAAGLG